MKTVLKLLPFLLIGCSRKTTITEGTTMNFVSLQPIVISSDTQKQPDVRIFKGEKHETFKWIKR